MIASSSIIVSSNLITRNFFFNCIPVTQSKQARITRSINSAGAARSIYGSGYARLGTYPSEVLKDRKRAIRKRAERLEMDKGELFFLRKNGQKSKSLIQQNKSEFWKPAIPILLLGFGVTKTCRKGFIGEELRSKQKIW